MSVYDNVMGAYQQAGALVKQGQDQRKKNALAQLTAQYASTGQYDPSAIAANDGNPLAFRDDQQKQKQVQAQMLGRDIQMFLAAPSPQGYEALKPRLQATFPNVPVPPQFDPAHMDGLAKVGMMLTGQKPGGAHVIGQTLLNDQGGVLYQGKPQPHWVWDSARGMAIDLNALGGDQGAPAGATPQSAPALPQPSAPTPGALPSGVPSNGTIDPASFNSVPIQNGPNGPYRINTDNPVDAAVAGALATGKPVSSAVTGALPRGAYQVAPPVSKQSELDKKIATAKAMGATPEQIKAMVLGNTATTSNGLTADGQALLASAMSHGYNLPIPNMGMGASGTAAKMKAINDLADTFIAQGLTPDDAVSAMIQGKTATGGLATLQRTAASVKGWEASAQNQAQIALEMSNKVDRTGVPVFNRWLMAGRKSIEGNVDAQRFSNASDTFAEEYAKVIGAGNASATDSARAQAHSMINTAQTADQYAGVISLMLREMSQRNAGLDTAIQAQRNAITGKKPTNNRPTAADAHATLPPLDGSPPPDYNHLWNH
jgi:hypothetical protein